MREIKDSNYYVLHQLAQYYWEVRLKDNDYGRWGLKLIKEPSVAYTWLMCKTTAVSLSGSPVMVCGKHLVDV